MEWGLLGILLAVSAVLCAVGFYKFVYFLSIGYGFAVAVIEFYMQITNLRRETVRVLIVQRIKERDV